jgi:argininosuccinate lyase
LSALSVDDYQSIAPEFGADVKATFDPARSIAARDVIGGTSPHAVRDQIMRARAIQSITPG